MSTNALILSGGGARAAYQVGVLSAVRELLPPGNEHPFKIVCGTSAGALNALSLASHQGDFNSAVARLDELWRLLDTKHVFKTDWQTLSGSGVRLLRSLFNEGMARTKSLALLDNQPLREFLTENIAVEGVKQNLVRGTIEAVSVTAMNYTSGESVNFYEAEHTVDGWRRYRRVGERADLTIEHLMASSAIPGIFPAIQLGNDFYADGALRQVAPISPALHLGAEKVLVIGVSGNRNPVHWGTRRQETTSHSPSIAQVFGHLFNSAFIDGLESDIEHIERVNQLLEHIPDAVLEAEGIALRKVDTLVISPSEEIDQIARQHLRAMPRTVRFFLGLVGASARAGGAATASYLLFEQPFIKHLIELGYSDAMWEKDKIIEFFAESET